MGGAFPWEKGCLVFCAQKGKVSVRNRKNPLTREKFIDIMKKRA
ncbi:hypothetical protein BLAHAN_06071 [Blautia hansenii DSM 20583]|uniref:Uncharacterized protein n=1 Tax=Blautia hansenii DSM 20583 TaxID=537007 RepID=C9L9I8_BLAHA|nr:hypothetical protein BLAHAN_06071 [Blautia hansenii DSM 20583]